MSEFYKWENEERISFEVNKNLTKNRPFRENCHTERNKKVTGNREKRLGRNLCRGRRDYSAEI
ncbi:hypothetical protein ABE44_15470 [Bacillus thuringiensis]|nr:hypothetical protein [Bacillus thuringiensis]MBG9509296.1 hypothetical protein [Bacillus thuringiensis]